MASTQQFKSDFPLCSSFPFFHALLYIWVIILRHCDEDNRSSRRVEGIHSFHYNNGMLYKLMSSSLSDDEVEHGPGYSSSFRQPKYSTTLPSQHMKLYSDYLSIMVTFLTANSVDDDNTHK